MDITSPSLFARAATSPSYWKAGQPKQGVVLKVDGSASLVQKLVSQQDCVMDMQSLLFVVEDDLRQISMMGPSLGLEVPHQAQTAASTGTPNPSEETSRGSRTSSPLYSRGSRAASSDRQSPLQTVVVARHSGARNSGSWKDVRPPQSTRTSTSSSTNVRRHSTASGTGGGSAAPSRRVSQASQGGTTAANEMNSSQSISPPAYTSRRTSGGVSQAQDSFAASAVPDFPPGAFDPDAASFNVSFNTSVRVHPKDNKSAMPRRTSIAVDLLCPSVDDLPVEEVAVTARRFAFAHRKKLADADARSDLAHEWLVGALAVSRDEEEARERLAGLLVAIEEETARYLVYGEYDKFVVFCIENEPVWRRAAHTLQQRKEERLNSTENTFARFAFIDNAVQQKSKEFQEYSDFMVSLKMVEHDELQIALRKARDRLRTNTVVSREISPPPQPTAAGGSARANTDLHAQERRARRVAPTSTALSAASATEAKPPNRTSGRNQGVSSGQNTSPVSHGSKGSHNTPTPPRVPKPSRPSPRVDGNAEPALRRAAPSASSGSTSSGNHAHIRSDRATGQVHSSQRGGAALTATESEPRFHDAVRPQPWMHVERIPNP